MKHSPKKQSTSCNSNLSQFVALKDYIDRTSVGGLQADGLFSISLKASLAKCYEFNVAVRKKDRLEPAFFWGPALRGICEDLIILKFLNGVSKKERENLISLLMTHEVYSRIKSQSKFFAATRPQQPVLRLRDTETTLAETELKILAFWNNHGWPRLNHGTKPQIRQIAERLGQSAVATLYDYLYGFTSGTVHFSVQSLLRSGWGESPEQCKFSTTNLQPYFSQFACVYGAFLFCIYFEFFGRILRPSKKVSKLVAAIRREIILEPRWPEMVTFEEMNLKPPDDAVILRVLVSSIQARETKKFIRD